MTAAGRDVAATATSSKVSLMLTGEQRTDAFLQFRRDLRAARSVVQADAEAYVAVWKVVESVGKYLGANGARVPKESRKN